MREEVISKAKANAELFRPKFITWLQQNFHVYVVFEQKSLYQWRQGRDHYSARTIFEVLRFETCMHDNSEFKLNDHYSPDCARLFMLLHPECGEFFELRGRAMTVDQNQANLFGAMA